MPSSADSGLAVVVAGVSFAFAVVELGLIAGFALAIVELGFVAGIALAIVELGFVAGFTFVVTELVFNGAGVSSIGRTTAVRSKQPLGVQPSNMACRGIGQLHPIKVTNRGPMRSALMQFAALRQSSARFFATKL